MALLFKDRESARPNRYRVVPDSGSAYYVTLERADEPIILGTPLNAEVLNGAFAEKLDKTSIHVSDTEPTDWVDGDIWLKPTE